MYVQLSNGLVPAINFQFYRPNQNKLLTVHGSVAQRYHASFKVYLCRIYNLNVSSKEGHSLDGPGRMGAAVIRWSKNGLHKPKGFWRMIGWRDDASCLFKINESLGFGVFAWFCFIRVWAFGSEMEMGMARCVMWLSGLSPMLCDGKLRRDFVIKWN